MEVLFELLKYILPALIVFFTTYLFLRNWRKLEQRRMDEQRTLQMKDDLLPIRLQAYERLILFLERISPESILMRMNRSAMTADQLKNELLHSIRQEYEHNIAQQTYISAETWQKVQAAKNQNIQFITSAASELKPDASGSTLGKLILEKVMEVKTPPSQAAIAVLKEEVNHLFFS